MEYQQSASDRAERHCSGLYDGIRTSTGEEERAVLVRLLLEYLAWIFRFEEPLPAEFDYSRGAIGGFIFLHKALKNPRSRDPVWEWTTKFLRAARGNESYQSAIAIGVFELLAGYPLEFEVPTEAEFIDRFFRTYEDPDTRWIVFRSYQLSAGKLTGDIEQYSIWCAKNEKIPPKFDRKEICDWVKENDYDLESPD